MAGLNFAFTGDNANFMRALKEVTAGVHDATRQIESEGVNIEQFFTRIRNLGALSFAGFGIGEIVSKVKDTRAYFQDIESSMKVFLGDADKAAQFTKELQDYAYYNMYEFADLADASKQLIAYGNDAEDVTDIIQKLSEVGIATGQNLGEMVNLYNRAKSTGIVDSNAIDSWASKGLILKDVMKEMGTYVEGQTISFKQLNEILDTVTSEGGMFHGIQDAQMENISANIGQMEDNLSLMFNEIGEYLQQPIYEVLQFGSDVIDHWKEVGLAIAAMAASVGTQKAVDIATITIDRTATQAMYAAEIAQLEGLLPKKEEEAQTSLQQAVASGHLTEAKAAEITALREQVEQYQELLEKKEEEAAAEALLAEKMANDSKEAGEELIAINNDEIESLKDKIEANKEWLESLDENTQWMYEDIIATENDTLAEQINTLATENNSIQEEINTAAQNANAAARNRDAIAAEREAVATGLDTAATTKSTFATRLLTTAKTLLAKAQAKLNEVISANPYAIAIAAVAALAYGIYTLATYETEAERTTREIEEATQSVNEEYAKEDKKLKELFKSFGDVKKGTEEWANIKSSLINQYSSYLSNLDTEIEKCTNLKEVYNLLTKAIQTNMAAKGLKSFYDKNDVAGDNETKLVENLEELRNSSGLSESTMDKLTPLLRDFAQNSDAGSNLWEYLGENLAKTANGDTVWADAVIGRLKREDVSGIISANKATRKFKSDLKQYQKVAGISDEVANEVLYGVSPQKEYEDARTEEKQLKDSIDAKKKQWHDIDKSTAEGAARRAELDKEIESLEKEYESRFGKTYDQAHKSKKPTGPTAMQLEAREESAEGKLADVLRKQQAERLRIEQDFEFERWQNRIDLMDEGEQKVLAQQKLNFEKEKTDLKRRMESELESELQRQMAVFDARQNVLAAADKKYTKQTFRDSDIDDAPMEAIKTRYAALEEDLTMSQQKAEADRAQGAREAMNAYLKEFGSYQQKRVAIAEEYARKIAEAQNPGERRSAIAGRDRALADLDFNEWQEGGGMSLAFGDLSKLSKQTISTLIADMEKYRSKIIATFDPDKIKKYEDALTNLREANALESFFGDNDILDALRERLALQQQVADAQADEVELLNQKKRIEEELNEVTAIIMAPSIDGVEGPDGEPTQTIDEEAVAHAEELRVKLDAVTNALSKSSQNARQLETRLKTMGKVKFADISKFSKSLLTAGKNAGSLAKIFNDDIGNAITEATEALDGMFDAFTTLSSNIDVLSKSGKEAVQGTADSASGIVAGTSAGMTAVAAVGSQSLQTLEKASAILAIIGAAIQLATIVASLFDSDKKHEENIKNLQKQIDALQKSYERLGKAASDAYSTDASALIEQQNRNLMLQKALVQQQMMEEQEKKNADDEKMQQYRDRLDEIDEAIADNRKSAKEAINGEDVKSAISDFSSALTQAWAEGRNAAEATKGAMKSLISSALTEDLKRNIQPAATAFYDALAEAMADGVLTDEELANLDRYKEDMDAAAEARREQYEMIEERYKDLDELREELTDISFDSVADNFKSLLTDMESSAADFTDNFSEMLRGALVEGLMTSKYDRMLKDWYEGFADAMTDGRLTDEERQRLRQEYDAIVQQGLADRDAINEIVGGGAYSQSASTGGWETMGQDQAMELNGRFTALTELSAIGNQYLAEGNAIAARVLATLEAARLGGDAAVGGSDNDTLLSIKDMMFLSTGYLEDIAKYSRHLAAIDGGIEELRNLIDKRL